MGTLAKQNAPLIGQGKDTDKEKVAKLKICNGLRMILQGLGELWRLQRSFQTKPEHVEGASPLVKQ